MFIKLEYLTADKAVSAARHNVPLQMKLGLQAFDVLVIDPSISTFQRCAVMTDKYCNTYLAARLSQLRRAVIKEYNYLACTVEGLKQAVLQFRWLDAVKHADMTERFPVCLSMQLEPIEIALDRLNRAEKQEAIPSVAYWIEARRLRNSVTHEYTGNVGPLRQSILRTLEHCSNV